MTIRIGSILVAAVISWPVVAAELTSHQNAQIIRQMSYATPAEESADDCCWDKVDFDRPLQAYEAAQGPDCCWVLVWDDVSK